MTTHAHIVPETRRRLRRCDADDAAENALGQARSGPNRVALFLTPGGEFLAAIADSLRFDGLLLHCPASLVGVYSGDATKADVVDDVRIRAESLGIEWPEV